MHVTTSTLPRTVEQVRAKPHERLTVCAVEPVLEVGMDRVTYSVAWEEMKDGLSDILNIHLWPHPGTLNVDVFISRSRTGRGYVTGRAFMEEIVAPRVLALLDPAERASVGAVLGKTTTVFAALSQGDRVTLQRVASRDPDYLGTIAKKRRLAELIRRRDTYPRAVILSD